MATNQTQGTMASNQTQERKGPLFTFSNRIEHKARFQPGRVPNIIIVTGPSTVPGRNLNPGPLSLEESAFS